MASTKNILSYESKIHGKTDFPYAVYMVEVPDSLKSFPLHWHEDFEIILIQEGELLLQVQELSYTARKGDIVLVPCGALHSIRQSGKKTSLYFNILFKLSLLEPDDKSRFYQKYFAPLAVENGIINFIGYGTSLNKDLYPIIKRLIEERDIDYDNQELVIKGLLFFVLEVLQSTIRNDFYRTNKEKKHCSITKLKPLLKKISDTPQEQITIEQAASICAMSETYFMKFFKKMTGLTFTQYLNLVRLERAQTLLKTTDLSVLQVSEYAGFNNLSYFIRSFKKHYGRTPGQWRK